MRESLARRAWRELDALEAGKWWNGVDPIPAAALEWLSEEWAGMAPEDIYLGQWDSAIDYVIDYTRRDFARKFPAQPWEAWEWLSTHMPTDWEQVALIVGQFSDWTPVPMPDGYIPRCDRLDVPVYVAKCTTLPGFWNGIIPGGAR